METIASKGLTLKNPSPVQRLRHMVLTRWEIEPHLNGCSLTPHSFQRSRATAKRVSTFCRTLRHQSQPLSVQENWVTAQ